MIGIDSLQLRPGACEAVGADSAPRRLVDTFVRAERRVRLEAGRDLDEQLFLGRAWCSRKVPRVAEPRPAIQVVGRGGIHARALGCDLRVDLSGAPVVQA